MLSRKNGEKLGNPMPQKWIEELKSLLNSVYKSQCSMHNREFEVYGTTYEDEVLIIASFIDQKNQNLSPVTYMFSADIDKNNASEKILKVIVDSIGIFFDDFFNNKDWNEYQINWCEAEYNKTKFFYKSTRENIKLTLEASKILQKQKS